MSDSGKITVNYFCLGAFFIFIGSVLLCALGFTVVLPFEVTRAWPAVTCTVINSTYEPNVCSCDEQLNVFDTCVSKYPCLQIHVFYVPPSNHGSTPSRRGGADRRRRSPDWIGEDLDLSLNASEIQFAMETDAQNVPEGSTSFASVLVDQQRVNDSPGVAASDLASTTSVPATPTETRYMETVERDSEELENVGFVQRRSLLSSTLLPVSKKHTSKADIDELDRGTLSPDGVQSQVENWNESLRISKYGMEDNDIDVTREEENRGTKVFAMLYRSWDDSFNRQCTLTECGDETWNVKEARRFKDDWGGLGQSFPCFYNPLRPDMVIIERTSTVAAVHAVLWPGLCLIGGVTLWLGLCLGCWSLGSESTCKDDYGPIY